tara:strand:- start:933 stop:1613 length:681 start_codon:yes stop_codon:yes gene_type:complete
MVSLNVLGKSILLSVEKKEIVFAPLDFLVSQMEYIGFFIAIESIFGGRYFLVMISAVSIFTIFLWGLKTFVYTVSGGYSATIVFGVGVGIFELYCYLVGSLFAFTFLTIYFKWNLKLIVKEDMIVDFFPKNRSYTFEEIESIQLVSPKFANILIKSKDSSVKSTVSWFGNNEQDWLDFLKLLLAKNPLLEEKVFVTASLWNATNIKKVTVQNSYKEISKLYGEFKF